MHDLAEAGHEPDLTVYGLGKFRATGEILQIFDPVKRNFGVGKYLAVQGHISQAQFKGQGSLDQPALQLFDALELLSLRYQGGNQVQLLNQLPPGLCLEVAVQAGVGIPRRNHHHRSQQPPESQDQEHSKRDTALHCRTL